MTRHRFRTATVEDIETMLVWAAAEGWNPGLDDARAFGATDAGGFFVAEVGGEPVASISVVNHCDDVAFLGFYICRPDHRARGIGYALWNHALKHAGARVVGLDGVADQEANYAKSGFVRSGATLRLEGQVHPRVAGNIREATAGDVAAVHRLDIDANGYPRNSFLSEWIQPTQTRRTVVLADADVRGFATVRRCRDGAKIGPIVSRDTSDALSLAQAAVSVLPTERAIIDAPSGQTEFLDCLRGIGFSETFATARMYRGAAKHGDGSLRAIATMELG